MLDNLPWHALNTEHARLALRTPGARKYPADVAPFAGTAENSSKCLEQLFSLLQPGETVFVVSGGPLKVPPDHSGERLPALQMIAGEGASTRTDACALPLSAEQAHEMMELTTLAFPGFFRARTYEMGAYYGIRIDGQLVAMAGERMAVPGYREVSGVCTHPAHTGKGYAARLILHLMQEHVQKGLKPFLHVSPENARAIALYTRLGFRVRREVCLYPFTRRD